MVDNKSNFFQSTQFTIFVNTPHMDFFRLVDLYMSVIAVTKYEWIDMHIIFTYIHSIIIQIQW